MSTDKAAPQAGRLRDRFATLGRPTEAETPAPTTAPKATKATKATPTPRASTDAGPSTPPAKTAASTPDASSQTGQAPPRPPASQAADATLKVRRTAYVPAELHRLAAQRCAADGVTRTELVLFACGAAAQRGLPQLLVADRQRSMTTPVAAFPDLQLPARHDEPTKAMPLLFSRAQLRTIDGWVESQPDAKDRSHLITVALRAYLTDPT